MKKRILKVSAILLASVLTFTSCGQFVDRADALETENGATLTAESQESAIAYSEEVGADITAELPEGIIIDGPVVEPTDPPAVIPPVDVPADTPVDVPADTPVDVPTDTPADVPADPPADAPTDPPADVPTDTPENGNTTTEDPDEGKKETNIEKEIDEIFKPADPVDDVKDPDAIVDKKPVSSDDGRVIYVSKKGYVYSKTENTIYEFLTDECGLNTAAACAVLGNMFMESMLDPEAYGASENAWGLCQWENGRLVQLQQRYPNNWKTLNGQLHYLKDEFNSSSLDPWGPQTYNYLLNLPNTVAGARDGALYFAKWFERCASASYGQRQSFAEEFFDEWMGAVTPPTNIVLKVTAEDSVKCTWKRPGNAVKTALEIYDSTDTKLNGGVTTKETYTFTGLKYNKTYKVRMWSIADSGKISSKVNTTVKIANIPNTITVSGVTKTSLAVPWVFGLGATANDKAKITYESNSKSVRVGSNGKLSIKAKFVGSAKITVTAAKTKKYAETKKTVTVKVVPPKPESFKAENLPITVVQTSWKEARPVTGYQIQWSKDKTFKKGVKSEKVDGKTRSYLVYGVKMGSTYYVRVRGYKTLSGKNYYSSWTNAKKVKITK